MPNAGFLSPVFKQAAGIGIAPPIGFRSPILPWIGGLASPSEKAIGFRSAVLPHLGGLAAPQVAAIAPIGFRSAVLPHLGGLAAPQVATNVLGGHLPRKKRRRKPREAVLALLLSKPWIFASGNVSRPLVLPPPPSPEGKCSAVLTVDLVARGANGIAGDIRLPQLSLIIRCGGVVAASADISGTIALPQFTVFANARHEQFQLAELALLVAMMAT
jgi:hypothetical protein